MVNERTTAILGVWRGRGCWVARKVKNSGQIQEREIETSFGLGVFKNGEFLHLTEEKETEFQEGRGKK